MSNNEKGRKAIPERSAQTQWLIARLRKLESDETIPYAELHDIAGCSVQAAGRGYLSSARRAVLREYGIVTAAVLNVGIKRLANEAIHGVADAAMSHIRRTTRSTNSKMQAADIAALPAEIRSVHLTRMAQLGVLNLATTDKYSRRIKKALGQSMEPPPLSETIKALKE